PRRALLPFPTRRSSDLVDVTLSTPRVPYRETIRGSAKAEGRYVRQTGGHGQYGVCWVEVQPLPRGSGFEFQDKIVGGVVSHSYRDRKSTRLNSSHSQIS